MTACSCASKAPVISLGDEDGDPFVAGFTAIAHRDDVELRRCDRCGAHWQVDTGRDSLAIRVEDPERWSELDDRPIRMRMLVKKLGGQGLTPCMWAGCDRRALRVSGVCPHHAFPSLSTEVDDTSPRDA